MATEHRSGPRVLENWAFIWSQARLIIAAVALFLGGVPPAIFVLRSPGLYGVVSFLLSLSWIISGITSAYLFYRWLKNGNKVFGGKERFDVAAFFVSVVSGLNLGIAGLTSSNLGMTIFSSKQIFAVVGALYLVSAWHLQKRWNSSGGKIVS